MNRKRDIILSLILTLFVISAAVCLTVFFKQLYYFDIDYLDIVSFSGYSKEVIKKNYDILIQYQSLFFQGVLDMPDFPMSITGRIHFEEVKRIFEFIQVVCGITGVVSVIMIYQNIKQKEYRFLRLTSFFTVGIPSVIGFLAALDFNKAFIIFHKIAFNNDYWLFDYTTDPIIKVLPETFFMHCFIMIVLLVIVASLLLHFLYKRKMKEILEHA